MSYKHLTASERYQIYALSGNGCTLREIGGPLGRNPGTISREVRHNRGERGYKPKQAQGKAESRSSTANTVAARTVLSKTWEKAQAMLRLDQSPEQISGRLQLIDGSRISHATIYLRIYADKAAGGDLHLHLRCQKKRRNRYGSGQHRRGVIPNRVGIEERPADVESRSRVGHWEMDTVVGCNHKGFLVTMVERKAAPCSQLRSRRRPLRPLLKRSSKNWSQTVS